MVSLIRTFVRLSNDYILYQKTKYQGANNSYLLEYGIFLSYGLVFLDIQPFSIV